MDPAQEPYAVSCDAETLRAMPAAEGRFTLSSDRLLSCSLGNVGRIAAKSRHVSGTVDPAAGANTQIAVTLDQITIEGGGTRAPTIDRLVLTRTGRPAADGRFDIDVEIATTGLSLAIPHDTGMLTIDRMVFDCSMPGSDSRGQIQAAIALVADAGNVGADTAALRDRLVGAMGKAGTATLTAEGLQAKRHGIGIRLASLAFGAGYRNLTREGGDITFRLDAEGIATDPKWAYDAWTPTAGTAQISIEDFPIWQIFASSFADRKIDSEAEDKLFRESRMRFLFDTVRLSAPDATLDFGGAIATNPDAVLGSAGTLKLHLTGIDGLVKALQADPKANQAAAGLTMLQVLGRQTTTSDGKSARDYEIVIDPSGKVLVNGADVQAMIPKDL
ncbi:hypothetical protein BWR60_30990 [Inquilinus limosus]|uniref:DUF2125 domain-containing protein n=2 Tax=Inquilinus limosus TaxID=171674 RepID=A0A211Z831_9PROT|nr:hypothetical protein BWR60_30990 [Inquilinus limosus]